jgi:signal transduction histidine kinase
VNRWQQWTLRAIYDDNGRFIEYQAVGRDSTEQKAFELHLQQSRNMLQSVFDGIADPLMMIGRDLRVLMLNRAALKYYDIGNYKDIRDGEARGNLFGQYRPDDQDGILQGILGKQALSFDLTTVGEPRKYEKVSIYPVRGESRKDDAAIVRISDMTKEKILERQSSQSEKLASLGLLTSGLMHEINNPNNFIIFNIPILRDYVKEILPIVDAHARCQDRYELFSMPYEEFRDDLLRLLKNMEHGAHRINNTIGLLSELTCKRENGERRLTNLAEVIEKAVTICQPQIRSHVRHFQVDLPPDLPLIFTDPESLEQILINLLINAAQACDKEDSRVTLSVSKGKTWQNRFIIEVTDNGCGMDEDMAGRIFEPFFTTKPQGLGTGLGLYISRTQIERLGGHIEVKSRPGEGSTFRITLPDVELQADSRIH